MNELLMKLVNGKDITDDDIAYELYEVCDRVHSGCDSECPVFKKNGGIPWNDDQSNCKYFKNGTSMLAFLRVR